MKRLGPTFAGWLVAAACSPSLSPGPDEPFFARARPRNPDHFVVGNGSEIPLPYEVVRSLAISTGAEGMVDFEFQDWVRPSGSVQVSEEGEATRYVLELEGLVPDGLYTAWLVRIRGSARGPKRDLNLGPGYDGPPAEPPGSNAILADAEGRAEKDILVSGDYVDAADTPYFGVDFWDEVHVAFHADNRAYGFVPGPNHWTQVVLPVRPNDGSAHLALGATAINSSFAVDAFADVMAEAASSGIPAAADYGALDWTAATGTVTINVVDLGTTRDTHVLLTADGLVTGGAYSVQLARTDGVTCPVGGVRIGSAAEPRALFETYLELDKKGRGQMKAVLTPDSPCSPGTFEELGRWQALEVRFHSENRYQGIDPGRSFVQLSVTLPPVVIDPPR